MERDGKIFRDDSIPISKIQDWSVILDGINSDITALFADFINYVGALLVPTNISLTGLTNITIGSDLYLLQDKQRLFLKGQTNVVENGLYVYSSGTQNLTRITEISDLLIGSGLSLISNTLALKLSANESNILRFLPDGLIFRIDPTTSNGLVFTEAGLGIDPDELPDLGEFSTSSFLPPYVSSISNTGATTTEQYQPLIGKVFTIQAKYLRTDATVEVRSEFENSPLLLKNVRDIVISITNYVNTLQFTADLVTLDLLGDPLPVGTHRNRVIIKNGEVKALNEFTGTPHLLYEHTIVVPTEFIITNITWTGNWVQGTAKNLTIALSDNAAIGAPYTYSVPAWLTVNSVVTNTEGVLVLSVTPTSYGNLSGNITVTASGVGTPTTPAYSISFYAESANLSWTYSTPHSPTVTSTSIVSDGIRVGWTAGNIPFEKITNSLTYPNATLAGFEVMSLTNKLRFGLTNKNRSTTYATSDFDYYVEVELISGTTFNYDVFDKNGLLGTTQANQINANRFTIGFLNNVANIILLQASGNIQLLNVNSLIVPTGNYHAVLQILSGTASVKGYSNQVLSTQYQLIDQLGHWIAG